MTQLNAVAQLSSQQNQLAKHAIHIHKFGGSSLATAQCIERVVDIIRLNCQLNDLVVVSANGDTTDELFSLYQHAIEKSVNLSVIIAQLAVKQQELLSSLLNKSSAARLIDELNDDIKQLSAWLTSTPEKYQADLLAYGEVWSARLLSAVLSERVCPSYSLDARDFLVVNNDKDCILERSLSQQQLQHHLQQDKLVVVTGYITKNSLGETCTLGRNGSDYSATIMASLSGALNVTLWTDVDGIYSADPRIVPLARKLHRLPNGVAKELGRLGNPVLHAKTLQPLINHNTHLHVASSFAPQISGTEIGKFGQIAKQELSVTHLNELLLARSPAFTGELAKQASNEFLAICADQKHGFIVIHQAQEAVVSEWMANHDEQVSYTPVAILATVGHGVVNHGNMQARFKRALKHSPLLYIVNSASEHSIIAIFSQPCTGELLNNVHHDMTKDARHIGVVVAGLGNIGQRFLELLPAQLSRVSALENVHLVGLLSSKKALINTDGLDVHNAFAQYQAGAQDYDNSQLMTWLSNHPYDELIVVDITPSESFSLLYGQLFEQGIHVIGANKWAASSSTENYNYLMQSAAEHKSYWLGNTTVGAGLPINYAIEDLLNSGDEITEISGIFSGTLSWLFETYDGSVAFSTLLTDALAQGITEPDPREDLSGRDVQRKLLILARTAGLTLCLEDIECQNLVPEALQSLTTEEFLAEAKSLDAFFAQQLDLAAKKDSSIRYVAKLLIEKDDNLSNGRKIIAKVALETIPNSDAFANLTPCDNIFQLKSGYYQNNPLIIRGPGAGREVTAAGLHSDLVKICQLLVSKKHQVKIKGIR